jgi:signal transduction histidine kinase
MHRLVEDLLLLARADEHSDLLKEIDVDIDDIVYAELARVRTFTALQVSSAISPVRITGDPRALSRLIRNVVDNAMRHAYSTIRFECTADGGYAQIVVADDGPGVPIAERRRVFDRFVRLDSPRARHAGGAGLGLSIVAQIAEAHHGKVTIDETSGGGARFVARIPLAVDESVADTAHSLDAVGRER